MAKGMGGVKYPDPFNEVGSKDPNTPDVSGDGLYFNGWDEVMKMHLSTDGADMVSSSNSDASHDIYGGPVAGEPNPAGMGGKGGGK
jgi:hypothetical protein